MKTLLNRLIGLWQRLSGSLWFVPACFIFAAAGLAVVMVEISTSVDQKVLAHYPRLFGASAESSRSMLSTIAASMITVAGVTFSILVVAVSQATSQYTPRILRNFMRDRRSQFSLGVLVGVFVYCLVVIRTIRGEADLQFVPSLAVLTAFVLALVAVGFLMYFIHHIASTLDAGHILDSVYDDALRAIDRLFPDAVGHDPDPAVEAQLNAQAERLQWQALPARRTGYIQSVDESALLDMAQEHDLAIRVEHGIGGFVIEGMPLLSVSCGAKEEPSEETVDDLFVIDNYRTVYQDASFGIRQMVDLALKALSPGINDVTTAVTCIDYLTAVMVRLASRNIPSPHRQVEGRLRVIAHGPSFQGLLGESLNEIRQVARSNVRVLGCLLRLIERVALVTTSASRRQALLAQVQLLHATALQGDALTQDRQQLLDLCEQVQKQVAASTSQ